MYTTASLEDMREHIKDIDTISEIREMGDESLSPDKREQLELILIELVDIRGLESCFSFPFEGA